MLSLVPSVCHKQTQERVYVYVCISFVFLAKCHRNKKNLKKDNERIKAMRDSKDRKKKSCV